MSDDEEQEYMEAAQLASSSRKGANANSSSAKKKKKKPTQTQQELDDALVSKYEMNPAQDPLERREIRQGYRELAEEVDAKREEYSDPNSSGAATILERANQLFTKVKNTPEAVMDAAVLVKVADVGRSQVQQLSTGFVQYETGTFVQKLIAVGKGRKLNENRSADDDDETPTQKSAKVRMDWNIIGKMAVKSLRPVPRFEVMFGPLEIVPKTVVRKKAVKTEKVVFNEAAAQRPSNDISAVRQEKDYTTKNVELLAQLLAAKDKAMREERNLGDHELAYMSYFDLVINPTSFAQTIENIFYVSFLVKDSFCAMDIINGRPSIAFIPQTFHPKTAATGALQRQQFVLEMTLERWQDIKKKYRITKCLIPQREQISDDQL